MIDDTEPKPFIHAESAVARLIHVGMALARTFPEMNDHRASAAIANLASWGKDHARELTKRLNGEAGAMAQHDLDALDERRAKLIEGFLAIAGCPGCKVVWGHDPRGRTSFLVIPGRPNPHDGWLPGWPIY